MDFVSIFSEFTDTNRTKSDRHNDKSMGETGAFLTWLKDENAPVFKNPEFGVVPLEVNNVDIVINANALLALSLFQKQSINGFNQAAELLMKCVENNSWTDASLYYPNKLYFPYSLSRAWREGRLNINGIEKALQKLMLVLTEEQKDFERQNPKLKGAFPCGSDGNYTFSTTLFLLFLLNTGKKISEEAEIQISYDKTVKAAIDFILQNSIKTKVLNRHHRQLPGIIEPVYWNSGVLYSSSIKDLAEWRSDSQCTALVLEALAKYVLNYDCEPNNHNDNQIFLKLKNNQLELNLPFESSNVSHNH
jgi:hypothetical protein